MLLGGALAGGFATVRQLAAYVGADVLASGQIVLMALFVCAVIAGTAFLLKRPVRAASAPSVLPLPASGFAPLLGASILLQVVDSATGLVKEGPGSQLRSWLFSNAWPYYGVYLVMAVNVAIVFTLLFNRPSRVAASWAAFATGDEQDRSAVRIRAAARVRELLPVDGGLSLLAVGVAAVVSPVIVLLIGARVLIGIGLFLGVAAVVDIADELIARSRAELVPVWQLARPYEVEPAIKALEAAGIPAFARAAKARAALQFFGPFVPIEVLVPPEKRERALKVFESALQN